MLGDIQSLFSQKTSADLQLPYLHGWSTNIYGLPCQVLPGEEQGSRLLILAVKPEDSGTLANDDASCLLFLMPYLCICMFIFFKFLLLT